LLLLKSLPYKVDEYNLKQFQKIKGDFSSPLF